ncbi:hypothetical protein [Lysinibacillus tabacifolii]|uniref:NERD domain-containing protein n=1 Tax=Lysinibacillus tabacifolii TaxID=1173107 RepID=A0ABY2T3N8_9BACI|nr:hypothetical protein [Lysinibacillus tabacifolii]TKI50612.1 hypothetical protein FC748_05225 [Lysinibacillus tabacifolii]
MKIRDLEKYADKEPGKLIENIEKLLLRNNYELALNEIKKSGICISTFGTGKPKNKKLYEKLLELLKKNRVDEKLINKFNQEVEEINYLYKQFNKESMLPIEERIPDVYHVSAYLIALENYLRYLSNNLRSEDTVNIFENTIQSTGDILKYLIYYKKLPINYSERVKKEYMDEAFKHFESAANHLVLTKILESWTYFDVEISSNSSMNFSLNIIDDYCRAKNITHLTFLDKRMSKMQSKMLHSIYNKTKFNENAVLAPDNFFSFNELIATEFLYDYFSTKNLNYKINEIPLKIYLRAYAVIESACIEFLNKKRNLFEINLNSFCLVLSKSKWKKKFQNGGIPIKYLNKLINFLTFNNKSSDLFDTPFIEIEDKLLVIPSIGVGIDSARSTLLNAATREFNISFKGERFEQKILSTLKDVGLKCENIKKIEKMEKENEIYECDAVFILDKTLFFVEIKNWPIPTTYREYALYIDEINKTHSQLIRISNYFTSEPNLKEIMNKFEVTEPLTVKRIILTNVPNGGACNFKDTIVTDDIEFIGYFKRRPPNEVNLNRGLVTLKPLIREYYSGPINSDQFIKFLEDKPFVKLQDTRINKKKYNINLGINIELNEFEFKNLEIIN